MARVVFTIRDFSDEYSSVAFPIPEPAADGSDWAAILTDVGTLQAALAAMTGGHIAKKQIVVGDEAVNDTRPALPWAQREIKWLVRYQDDTTFKKYTLTLPCAALELMSDGGDDYLDIVGVTAAATFVTWLENNMVSPDGNAITVNSISHVGRNI